MEKLISFLVVNTTYGVYKVSSAKGALRVWLVLFAIITQPSPPPVTTKTKRSFYLYCKLILMLVVHLLALVARLQI